jgi:xylulokinase
MAAILNGGLTLDWVRGVLGASWPELYAAAAVPPRPDAPFFLPQLHGERTPYLDPGMRGAWTRLDPRHDRRDLLRAALEGVAFAVREALDCLVEPGERIGCIRLAGGGTRDPGWRQMLADVLGQPLQPVEVAAASALGAADLGARTAGLSSTVRPPRDDPSGTVVPGSNGSLYVDRRRTYRRTVDALRVQPSTTTR